MIIDRFNKSKIGFVGLGNMGSGIARNIARAGLDIMVYDSNSDIRDKFAEIYKVAKNFEQLFNFSDLLMLSLPGSPEVENVVAEFMKTDVRGKVVIDLSTSDPYSSIELHKKMQQAGGHFMDAPLSGGPRNAAEGTLNTMVGGERELYEELLGLFKTFARDTFYVGQPGSGNTIKLASNYISILYINLYAEIIPFVEKMGVDPNELFKVVSVSGANSPIFQLVAPKIINQKHDMSFRMSLGIKDLSYIKKLFDQTRAHSAMLDGALSMFEDAINQGIDQEDISAIVKVVRNSVKTPKQHAKMLKERTN
ncbi:MAG: NAD(P)-dependent oxidoreductase [Planctomycetota bacterium]